MKKQLSAFILAVAITVLVNAGHAYGQDGLAIRVHVPFQFMAGEKAIPSGTYVVRPASDSRQVWTLQAKSGKASQFVLARNLSGVRRSGMLGLTFHRYGTTNFLVSFRTPSYEVGLPRSSGEKALQMASGGPHNMEVVAIGTIAAPSRGALFGQLEERGN